MDNNVIAKGVNAKLIQGQYGDFWSLGIKKEDFIAWLNDQPTTNGWMNLTLGSQKNDRMKGTLKLDTYKKKDNDPVPASDDLFA
jgi:hypothetical protein